MRTELVSIPTDTLPLDGAFYEPEGGARAGGVLLFHGNTMNFYVGAPRFLPPRSTAPASRSTAAGTISCRSATAAPPRGRPSRPPPKASPTTETRLIGWPSTAFRA